MVRFLHAADIHLDSPLRGLERYEGAPVDQLRGATRRALENLVTLAIDEQVDFVLFSGDLYDGDWRDYNTGLFFTAQMSRLREAGIRVVLLSGNHDAASEITRLLRPLENMRILSVRKPETIVFDDLGVAIHGQGFMERAVLQNLVPAYPPPLPGLFNIGMLHTSLSGREGHEPYAPCTVDDLVARGYDYWALGHVHQREEIRREPWIVFPGNLQGRHIRETGPKGCTLVEIDGGRVAAKHRALDVLRWHRCPVDAGGARDGDAVIDRVIGALNPLVADQPGRLLAVRLEVGGATPAHGDLHRAREHWIQEMRARASDASGGQVWLEKVVFDTRGEVSLEKLMARDDLYGSLMRSIHRLSLEDPVWQDLVREWDALRGRLPPEILREDEGIDPTDPAVLADLRDDVAQLLLPRLLAGLEAL